MSKYREFRPYENTQTAIYPGVGAYDTPQIQPIEYTGDCEFIPWSEALRTKARCGKGVHFFLDDYRFVRLWNHVSRYIGILKEFEWVMSPDFSMFTDFPVALQIYNHYRKHWLSVYWAELGVKVIPTINWSTPESYAWCFDGDPVGSTVAVSAVGTQQNRETLS